MTCLCLTRNRRHWLPKAIQCYQSQTYPNRELLILADGEDVHDLVPDNDDSIRLIHLGERRRIGDKRNHGCAWARGSIIAHWDDDDYSAPGRLEDQVWLLLDTGHAVTGYNRMRFTNGAESWEYAGPSNFAIGSSLCYLKSWWAEHPFSAIQIGEDGRFVKEAVQHHQLVTAEASELMTASIHPGNTSPRNLADMHYRKL